jgi:hypothetical protein
VGVRRLPGAGHGRGAVVSRAPRQPPVWLRVAFTVIRVLRGVLNVLADIVDLLEEHLYDEPPEDDEEA